MTSQTSNRVWARAALSAVIGLALAAWTGPALAAGHHAKPSASPEAAATKGLSRMDGLLPIYVDKAGGRILVSLPAPDAEGLSGRFLYQTYLRAGLGSNPVGLDRSKPGDTQVLVFRRAGKKVLVAFENYAFRANGAGPDERAAVKESFAASTVWQTPIIAAGPDGRLLIDLSGFLTRDALDIAKTLKDAKQGDFKLDADLSTVDTAQVLALPENVEFEASQTFASAAPGPEVRGIAPDARDMTLVIHHSLIKLPPPGFKPRFYDPRVNTFSQVVADYGAPLDKPLVYRIADRFRLEKTDPTAARSPVKKPIIFYVDRAAPEPVRSALVAGAAGWAKAFDAAGFVDAFKVEVLPDGISPLDTRYNVINWVHRQTRGWSYGQGIIDPRTGEIVKGSVLLGSQRIRQDRIIFEGLEGADLTGTGGVNDPVQIALRRLKQLSVHETGHAIGLAHNFAGSNFADRASVMDYPPPRVSIVDGRLDFADAYANGVGAWDVFSIRWLYSEFAPGVDEKATLSGMVAESLAQGMRFVSDDDSRPIDSGQPLGALWDDGPDSIAALDHVLQVRRIALSRFGLGNLPTGAPVSDLKRVIVPIYLFHRYEVDAVAKQVGGIDFTYGVKGDGRESARPVDGATQRRALAMLLRTVDPAELDLPDALVDQLSAVQSGDPDPQYTTELFASGEGPVFDLPTAADTAADVTFTDLFAPARLNRVVDLSSRDTGQLSLTEVLDGAIAQAFTPAKGETPRHAELRRRIEARLIFDLAADLDDKTLSPTAAAQVRASLVALGYRLAGAGGGAGADAAQARYFADLLLDKGEDHLRALAAASRHPVALPPGMPIGAAAGQGEDCWFCEAVGAAGR
jgi:hypothetical protein